MPWRKILLLSLLSLPLALASVFGLIPTAVIEGVVWLLLGLAIAWLLRGSRRPFLSGLLCGVLLACWQHAVGIALWDTYAAHNPGIAGQISAAAAEKDMSPQAFQLASTPMVAVVYGVVIGLLALGLRRIRR